MRQDWKRINSDVYRGGLKERGWGRPMVRCRGRGWGCLGVDLYEIRWDFMQLFKALRLEKQGDSPVNHRACR